MNSFADSLLAVELLRCNLVVMALDLCSSFNTELRSLLDLMLLAGDGGNSVAMFTSALACGSSPGNIGGGVIIPDRLISAIVQYKRGQSSSQKQQ